ncbi:MAG: cysteine-rich KTR domain-containing protein [Lachnospiraceae bacterium]|nr:cysteine-rich KTR domain-containing protein [uncultured Anaerostipes sp.]MDE6603474.1 cysteine-rich KTR domain-containing protein [Lachnospiraceae bacterium]MDE7272516.1 cysteine-rich KTR domain-containing protein [Lachnospiraceae bacterium]
MNNILAEQFVLCPVCSNKTRIKIRLDTKIENFPLYCPKCKCETLISINEFCITVIKEPDAQTQSR